MHTSGGAWNMLHPCSVCLSSSERSADCDADSVPTYFYPDISSAMQQIEMDRLKDTFADMDDEVESNASTRVWQLSRSMVDGEGEPFVNMPPSIAPSTTNETTESVLRESMAAGENISAFASRNASRPSFKERHRKHKPSHSQSSINMGKRFFSSTSPSRASHASPYDVLGVSRNASRGEIKTRYYTLVKTLHPDTAGPNLSEQERNFRLEKFRFAVKAYELLMDDKKRLLYDRSGVGWGGDRSDRSSSFGPRSDDDWEHWKMWTEVLRRGKAAHRSPGWQRMARHPEYQYHFYGYSKFAPEDMKNHEEMAPLNQKIFVIVFTTACVLAVIQISGLRAYGTRDATLVLQHSAQAAQNLEDARRVARSEEGQLRQRQMLERAREQRRLREEHAALSASAADETSPVPIPAPQHP